MEVVGHKIFRIIARLNVGGPALHCLLLSKNLARKGFETSLLVGKTDHSEADYEKLFRVVPEGFRIVRLGSLSRLPSLVGDLRTLLKLITIMKRERPTIVHTHTAKAGCLGRLAAWWTGIPVIVHTFHGHVLSGYFGAFFSKILCRLERWLARRTSVIITLSTQLRDELVDRFQIAPREKFRVIPLGRDLSSFFRASALRGTLRREFGLNSHALILGSVGRLVPIKDYATLIRACGMLPKNLEWHLMLAGEGPEEQSLRALREALSLRDRIHLLGWRSDLPAIYSDLDLFVLSSRNEGTPLSIIEAFASSCPVVATKVGGISDMFSKNSTISCEMDMRAEGILVPSEKPTALSNAINLLLSDSSMRKRCACAARNAADHYSEEALTEGVASLYQELLRA